jgi:hypothetical protein
MLRKATEIKGVPFRGGAMTYREKALIPFGGYSMIQNIRNRHPGFIQRPGQIKLHTTADSTNSVMSLYQFNKSRVSENHFYAQFSDSDVLEATTDPPGVTTGAFGSEVFSGTANPWPASWGNLSDILMFSNGVDQHQIYAGTGNYVLQFVKYDGAAAPPNVPELGFDYTLEVSDGLTSTVAVLDSLNTYANNECLFIRTPVPANGLGFTIGAANGNASTATVYYRKNDGTWADTSATDGTKSGSTTLAVDGSMTWTHPSDEVSCYMYGASGFWYQLRFSAQLDAEVEISKVTYQSAFQNHRNVWNGLPLYAVEVQVEGTTQYSVFGASSVDLDALASGKKIMIAASYPLEGIYIDPGETPNATGTALTSLKYWDGDSFETVGTTTDGTSGMSNAGWLTFPRKTDAQPHQFGGSSVYAYWYELIWDSAISADTVVAIETMPFFDIDDFGPAGQCNNIWKDRGVFSFNLWPAYIYITASGNITALNGTDYGILKAGDGRANKVVSMEKFHNELLVWQEEKGVEGGCTTLFEGYTPTTFGKLLLSAKIGTMNAKSTAVVDGVLTSTATDEVIKTLAFFLSRYGICATDGRTISIISDDIGDYFDPTHANCIRRGYEQDMWLKHDTAFNVIRVGLVAGSFCTGTDIAFSDSDPDTITTSGNVNFVTSGIKAGMKITTSSTTNTGTYTVATVSATTITLIAGDSLSTEAAGTFTIYPASPNVFPVFDLADKTWSFDDLAQTLGCMTDLEALSGNVPIVQAGGGIGDGFVYQLNTGTNDVSTAIDSYATMELDANGEYFNLRRMMLRCKGQSAGNIELTITSNDLTTAVASKTLSMVVERTGQDMRRHLIPLNLTDQHMSVKIQQDTASQEMSLLDIGLDVSIWENR